MVELASTPVEERISVPLGSRVLVRSVFRLGPEPTDDSRRVALSLAEELDRWQGTGVVVLGSALFADPLEAAGALDAHVELREALRRFAGAPERHICALDPDPVTSPVAPVLEALGISMSEHVELICATGSGERRVLVTSSPTSDGEIDVEAGSWLEGSGQLEDPQSARRFATSRALYRRLGHLAWIPPLLAIIVGYLTHLAFVSSRIRRLGRTGSRHALHALATASWRARVLGVFTVIVLVEILVAVIAVTLARRAYSRGQLPGDETSAEDAHARAQSRTRGAERVDQQTMDVAREQLSLGRIGAVVVGGPNPSLTHLGSGFLAVCAASTTVVREHRGRLGLPPVFLPHRQDVAILLETGADLHVQLLGTDEVEKTPHRAERLAAGETLDATPPTERGLRLLASWPTGSPWPPPVDLAAARGRTRLIRRISALSIFVTGLLDLLVAIAPPLRGRLHEVLTYLPLGVSQTAAAAVALIGIALVMVSRGVLRGQRRSWLVAVLLLGTSTVLHLAHGVSVGAILVTAAVLALLLVERRHFTATTDRSSLRAAAPALVTIVVVAILAAFMGVQLSNLHRGSLPSWPLVGLAVTERLVGLATVSLPDRIDDFVYPTMVTVGIAVAVCALYLITRPVVDRRLAENHRPLERRAAERRARDIVKRHGVGTLDYFALRDDKQYFFYGDTIVAYAVFGGIALISPDPIGPEAERTQVWAAFRNYCDARAWGVGVIGAGEEWLPIYAESGMRYLYLGDEAVVDVQAFSLSGGKMKSLRQACTRIERNGYAAEFLDPATMDPTRVPALVELMGLNRRGEGERGFSMMLGRLFDPKDQGLLLTIVTDADGRPAAMCQFVPSPAISGFSLDLMRRDPGEHPNGLLDFALCQTIEHLRELGAKGLSLNFSAFRSTLDGERGDGVTQRIERWGLKRLSSIMPIETLWKFNEKYQPQWLARHLVYASPEIFVPVVAAALRAESITEIPVLGRFLAQDPVNRPGTVVPAEILEAAAATASDTES
jgi:lysylphosphatidylglycerol synthetase-like protein (DUF2156 family)